jgi:membrane associated rhomboid family serine protease
MNWFDLSWLGPNWGFIASAYAAAAGLTLAAIYFTVMDANRQSRRLRALEAAGIRRRSRGT